MKYMLRTFLYKLLFIIANFIFVQIVNLNAFSAIYISFMKKWKPI